MANETSILAVLANLQAENQENNEQFVYNQDKLIGELQQKNASTSSLAITIVSLVGSFLAVLAFIGFLILGGIYDSTAALLILGFGFVAASVAINEVYNKPLLDTASVSVFASGIAIVAAGLEKMHISSDNIVVSIGSIALFTLLLSRSYILLFVSTIIASSSALWLIEVHRSLDFLPLYNSVMVAILAFWALNEAKITRFSQKTNRMYNPLLIGFIFALLFGLITNRVTQISVNDFYNYAWTPSIFSSIAILIIVFDILQLINTTNTTHKILIYTLTFAALLLTAFAPAISCSLLIMLLCFKINYRTGLVIGIISFLYFIGQYYYDLNMTLLTKSMLMVATGVIFSTFYFFTKQKRHLS